MNSLVSIEKLIELGVLRKAMFSQDKDWYVIYTENGAKDIMLNDLIEKEN